MKINIEIVKKISNLARIELNDRELEKITNSFGPISQMIDQVNEVNLEGEIKRNFRLKNIMREDFVLNDDESKKSEIISLFPDRQDNFLKTKKIL